MTRRRRAPDPWTQEEIDWVRENYANDGPAAIALLIGRSRTAVQQRARLLGVRTQRFWTAEQIDLVRQHYETMPGAKLADLIGKPLSSVYQIARKLGLYRCKPLPSEIYQRVKAMHAQGLTDREIAAATGYKRDTVKEIRRTRLGLPTIPDIEGKRQAVRTQCARLGISSPTELRTRAFRRFAIENGWPEDLRPREVQILNVLAARGVPMTRREIAAAIGMRSDPAEYAMGQKNILHGNGPGGTYCATLMRRGLVTGFRRGHHVFHRTTNRLTKQPSVYTLGPVALAILKERGERCAKAGTAV